ncbi:Acetyltransferase (GNAT) family protein [Anatilimnocola aggregata]|uniref:Acetyltransferase (GNAT) family protein n=1 Tax=Anatilimnocola aggregata TaxID=2528021 RepID=A0A517YF85_9BACT|nr:GNAT family N-acetyltransferase [Anatilimnocola aggregata]QDU28898.1 Acetyltransferase (GNAT) family protein [Anatilimnocola aggregata]
MGLQTEAKKGTVIEVNGVRIEVLRGSPRLEITAPPDAKITQLSGNSAGRVNHQAREMTISIRKMNRQDMVEVDRIQREAYAPTIWERIAVFEEKLNYFPDGCWLCEIDAVAAGYLFSHPGKLSEPPALNAFFATTTADVDCYFIHDVAVRPAFRGTGVGGRLAEQALRIASEQGFTNVALVSIQNSQAYWQRHGFEPSLDLNASRSVRSTYGEAACFMHRKLA